MDRLASPLLAACYRVAGKAAKFINRADTETDCTIVVSYDLSTWGEQVTVHGDQAVIRVRRTEVAAQPRKGDRFESDGVIFRVDQLLRVTEWEHTSLCVPVYP